MSAVLAASITTVIVGFSAIATKVAIAEIGPAALGMMRYGLAALCLTPMAMAARRWMSLRDLPWIALLGVAQFGLIVFLFNSALEHVTPARAMVILSTTPLWAMVIQVLRGREPLDGMRVVAVALCIFGVTACVWEGGRAIGEPVVTPGDLMVLAAAVIGALCSIGFKPFTARVGASAMTYVALVAAVAALAVATPFDPVPLSAGISPEALAMVIVLGVGSAIAFWLWLWVLGRSDASVAVAFLGAAPVATAVFEIAIFGRMIDAPVVVGILSVTIGLTLLGRTVLRVEEQPAL
ncbi:MAG: DMT family transporter [Azospirillaceae bacterium]